MPAVKFDPETETLVDPGEPWVGLMEIEAGGATLNVAVTVVTESMGTAQEPVPEQRGLHPAKTEPSAGWAFRKTEVPVVYSAVQTPELRGPMQEITGGVLVTVPPPVPVVLTVRWVPPCPAQTGGVGTTANASTSSEMIRNGNICRTRRCLKTPQAEFEEPANISQFRRETTTLNAGKPRIPYTLAPHRGGAGFIGSILTTHDWRQ